MRISLATLALGCSGLLLAQEGTLTRPVHRFHIDAGLGFRTAHRTELGVPFEWNDVYANAPHGYVGQFEWPTLMLQGSYDIGENITLVAQYNHWQEERWVKGGNEGTSFWNSVNTYMAGARISWIGNTHWAQLYTGLMLGPAFRHLAGRGEHTERLPLGADKTFLAYQGTLLGLRMGRTTSFILEYGGGYTGMITMGLSRSF